MLFRSVLAVAATLWLRDTAEVLRFLVALFGRLPVVTPAYVYAAVMTTAGVMIVPPFVAAAATTNRLLRPSLVTAVCLLFLAVGAGAAYVAPAYTREQPLRRYVRALQDGDGATATWEVASVEPGARSRGRRARRMDPPVRRATRQHSVGTLRPSLRFPHHRPLTGAGAG